MRQKKRVPKFSKEYQQMAVERLKQCENISALSRELGVSRRLLYQWRDDLDPVKQDEGEVPPANSREVSLRKEVRELKRLLAEKTVEVDFFKGALQKVEARRRQIEKSGGKASTTKSGK